MKNFKQRWNITSDWDVVVILFVFALTGSSSAVVAKPVLDFFGIFKDQLHFLVYYFFYAVLIFPIYQVLLLTFGYLFGQFQFFFNFEIKMLRSLKLNFIADFLLSKKGT